MEFDPQDQEILSLLTKLKDVNEEYPESLRVARRRSYLKRMTEISLGIGGEINVKNSIKKPRVTSLSPHTSRLLETILVITIAAEAGLAAYFYREPLSEFFQSLQVLPKTEELDPSSADLTSPGAQSVSPAPTVRSTAFPEEAAEPKVTPTGTPIPGLANHTPALNFTSTPAENQGNNGNHYGQTPRPERTKENKGNHYGQTPKPERTKENKGNNDKPPQEKEDKPPKDDKPPKEEPKPTKDK